MKKKSDKQVIRPDTCAKCNNGILFPQLKEIQVFPTVISSNGVLSLIVKESVFMRIKLWTDIH